VFLDRDGVITRSNVRDGRPYAPTTLDDFAVLPGVSQALQRLREAGYLNLVVTNQPDLSTGKQSVDVLDEMHTRLLGELAIDAIRVCEHVDAHGCDCRKPKPGMLVDLAKEWGVDLATSWMVGDRWRDIGAGQAAGCRCCFIECGYEEKRPDLPYIEVSSLAEAAEVILKNQHA
jgi:D-glycero-D-manno-heptose 1,7-bisphosphate phosphatase